MRFYQYREHWQNVINCVAELDALCALAIYSSNPATCRPTLLANDRTTLEIKGLKHALLANDAYVANDVVFTDKKCLVVTGPNMGGKSTLLRATCLAVVLAQIGCNVPAKSYTATLFDAIFTRIGAQDDILANKSTFFMEMEETN